MIDDELKDNHHFDPRIWIAIKEVLRKLVQIWRATARMPYIVYELLLVHAGNQDSAKPVPAAEIVRYRGVLPDGLLEFWARHEKGMLVELAPEQMNVSLTIAAVTRSGRRQNLIVDRFLNELTGTVED